MIGWWRKAAGNSFWLMGERVLRLGLSFSVGAWIARSLGPAQYGLLNYAISVVSLFAVLTPLGLDAVAVRWLVSHPNHWPQGLGTLAFLRWTAGTLVAMIFCVAADSFTPDGQSVALIRTIATAQVLAGVFAVDFYFQARVESRYSVFNRIFALVVTSGWRIALVLSRAPVIDFARAIVLENALMAAGFFFLASVRGVPVQRWRGSVDLAVKLLRQSWPLLLTGLALAVNLKIDQIMIRYRLDESALGFYAAAVRVSEMVHFIPLTLVSSFFPALVQAHTQDSSLFARRLQIFYDGMVWLGMLSAAVLSFAAPTVVSVVFGSTFRASGDVLRIHVWSVAFVFMAQAASRWFIINRREKTLMGLYLASAVVNVGLNAVWIPAFGINGAAWATLVSYAFAAYLGLPFFRGTRMNFLLLSRSLHPFQAVRRMIGWRHPCQKTLNRFE